MLSGRLNCSGGHLADQGAFWIRGLSNVPNKICESFDFFSRFARAKVRGLQKPELPDLPGMSMFSERSMGLGPGVISIQLPPLDVD